MFKNGLIILILLISSTVLYAQEVWMTPNKGQWDGRIEYKVDLQMGEMYLEANGMTYFLHNAKQREGAHNHGEDEHHEDFFQAHLIRSTFLNSSWGGQQQILDSSSFYYNYILGNNADKWFGHIHSASRMKWLDYYPGIDLMLDGTSGALNYTFVAAPNSPVDQILLAFEGQDKLSLDEQNQLRIHHRFGEIIHSQPKAWTENERGKTPVDVQFFIDGDQVGFYFPKGYNKQETLVIDPDIVFSTFSGSTQDNWGMTATPDSDGNTFGGGTVFNSGGSYPTTAGAFDPSFNGGTNGSYYGFDAAITKFNASGTSMVYSTYLGGLANEAPHSMFADENDELYVFGITSSADFPVTAGAYDPGFNGGVGIVSNELDYPQGTDIFVVHLNAAGSGLVGSTFVGGSNNDGVNEGILNYNYGDPFRGEIIVDNGSVYVSSTTRSSNFPVVGGGQGSLNGTQDAVIFKLNTALTTMNWSTYFGGADFESGNSVQISSTGQVFVTGGTSSSNLPISGGNDLTYNGGSADGYILKLNGLTGAFIAGTYLGQNEFDQCYFVQLDVDDKVYVYGQTESNFTISAGVYGNPNSGQFIRKYSNDLASIEWTTMIGGGTGHPEISPTAFLVSDCYEIYLSGWGGEINTLYSNQAVYSTSNGCPVTANAYQSSTNGSNFYIAVLSQDAGYLKYGTFMGGISNSWNHVDGGTSRFDKSGRIYHAVCGACGGNPTGFTTTPGVWSPTNQSTNCNMAVFKFELSTIEPIISTPNNVVCLPDPIIFNNNSANGNAFLWNFGDGTYSTAVNPTHVYPGPGTYLVTLVVTDTNGCYSADSVQMEVYIGDFEGSVVQPPAPICPGTPYQMEASGGTIYEWSPAQFLDNATIPNPIATVYTTTDFMVIISDTCGVDTVYVTLEVLPINTTISDDVSVCIGNGTNLLATGGSTYSWSPPTYLDDPNIPNPYCLPDVTTQYIVTITTATGCVEMDTVTVSVYYTPPIPVMPDQLTLCFGSTVDVTVSGADTYFWSPPTGLNTTTGDQVTITAATDIWYYCNFVNACGSVLDSMFVDVVAPSIEAGTDTTVCPGQSVQLWATGGISYIWYPSSTLSAVNTSLVTATPTDSTVYYVEGIDINGCVGYDSVVVNLFPQAFIQTCPDVYAFWGDEVQLWATSTTDGPYIWSPAEFLSCVVCDDPIAMPNQNYGYMVSYTDANGCTASDSVYIFYEPIIYVPNTFTPNLDGINTLFLALGGNIRSFEMTVYDRWGELIFTSNDMKIGWDGTYNGKKCQDGTYVWKIKATDFHDESHEYVGHVNLLR